MVLNCGFILFFAGCVPSSKFTFDVDLVSIEFGVSVLGCAFVREFLLLFGSSFGALICNLLLDSIKDVVVLLFGHFVVSASCEGYFLFASKDDKHFGH